MFRQRSFPPKFDPTIPSLEESPHWMFFLCTREFLLKKKRSWDFTKQENVRHFNAALTTAIHQDMDMFLTIFARFWERLQPVANAFESLHKAQRFLEKFEEFADHCRNRNFEWTEFQNYVRSLTDWVNLYVILLKSYHYYENPMTWPSPEAYSGLSAPSGIPDKLNYLIDICTRAQPNKNIVINAIRHYDLANKMFATIQKEYIEPQFRQLSIWLSGSQCLLDIRREFHGRHAWLHRKILQRHQAIDDAIEHLQYMVEMDTTGELSHGMKDAMEDSVDAVKDASISHRELVEIEHEYMIDAVLQVYDHALEVLKPFLELATSKYALGPQKGPTSHQEREDALIAAERWIETLENEKQHLLASKALPRYLEDLPTLYTHMAQFSFLNCGVLHQAL